MSVIGRVLSDDVQFLHAQLQKAFRFRDIVFDRNGTAVPPDQRNGAVGTAVVAAVGDPEIRGIGIVYELAVLSVGIGKGVSEKIRKQLRKLRIILDLHKQIHFRKLLETVFEITLDEASRNDQLLQLVFLVVGDLQDRINRFLLGTEDESAGIDHDRFAFFQIGCVFKKRIVKESDDMFGIDQILGTAQ